MMKSRERLLTALHNQRPDRLPCQIHAWLDYHLKTVMGGCTLFEANRRCGFDHVSYLCPKYEFSAKDQARWQVNRQESAADAEGNRAWSEVITTPEGNLTQTGANNAYTAWNIQHLIRSERDFELWDRYCPVPVRVDQSNLVADKEFIKDDGIIRTFPFSPGQGSPWQSLCCLMGTQEAIMAALDTPEWMHHMLGRILAKTLHVAGMIGRSAGDVIEVGGGAGSSTVISPAMFEEFCLPYDRKQCDAFHAIGLKVSYHLCGGVMPMLELVKATGADGLETMTPPSMGGNCDLREASRRVGDALFFIGGFDQNAGLERGTPEVIRQQVFDCFEATRDHAGYILAPSDQFFIGSEANLRLMAATCAECRY